MDNMGHLEDVKSAKRQQKSAKTDLSLCVTLLSLFDFDGDTLVTQDDWKRGAKHLQLEYMGEDDALWSLLLSKFRSAEEPESVSVPLVMHSTSIKPEVTMMFKLLYNGVVSTAESVEKAQAKLKATQGIMAQRAMLIVRRRVLEPVMTAWADLYRKGANLRRNAGRRMLARDLGQAVEKWRELCDEARRMARRIRAAERRGLNSAFYRWTSGLMWAFNAWHERHEHTHQMQQVTG